MSYVVLDYIAHEEHREEHADTRVNKKEKIVRLPFEPGCDPFMDGFDRKLQKYRCNATGHTDNQREDQHQFFLRHLALKPAGHPKNTEA